MLNSVEIERACEELESGYPCVSLTSLVGYTDDREYIERYKGSITFWEQNFVFILIVLASEGVDYDC